MVETHNRFELEKFAKFEEEATKDWVAQQIYSLEDCPINRPHVEAARRAAEARGDNRLWVPGVFDGNKIIGVPFPPPRESQNPVKQDDHHHDVNRTDE